MISASKLHLGYREWCLYISYSNFAMGQEKKNEMDMVDKFTSICGVVPI